jgi:hypothetical protein
MGNRLTQVTAIVAGVAAVAGGAIGFLSGDDPDSDSGSSRRDRPKYQPARDLPADLCGRIGDVSALFPRKVVLDQSGTNEVHCRAEVKDETMSVHSNADIDIKVETHASSARSPEEEAKREFDRRSWRQVKGRAYPTKVNTDRWSEESWSVQVISLRGDVTTLVTYHGAPAQEETVEQAVMAVADHAMWATR